MNHHTHSLRKTAGFIVLFLFALVFSVPVSAHAQATTTVKITSNGFVPAEVTVNQGDTVTFENTDTAPHWPASGVHPTHQIYPEFDPKQGISGGQSWSFTFDRAGTWSMHDHLNPQFTGSVTVNRVEGFAAASSSASTSNSSVKKGFFHSLQVGALKLYYRIFPSKLTKDLGNVKMITEASNESTVLHWLELIGSKKVMAKLLEESGDGAKIDCHTQAHEIGHAAYKLFGADAFKDGDSSCHSGFYHGAMEALINEKGTENFSDMIGTLCATFDTRFSNFECLHGVGHGVLAYTDYDLLRAVKICQELPSDFMTRSCYGGVFMENIVSGLGIGARPDHVTKWLSDDRQFPCNALPDDYAMVDDCYLIQTSWMFNLEHYDYAAVVSDCFGAAADHRHTCFKSYGRDAAGNTLRDPQQIIDKCGLIPADSNEYRSDCIAGAVNVIIDFWGEKYTNQADPVCAGLMREAEKLVCTNLIAQRMKDDFTKTEDPAAFQ